jgi:hypothetical protein
MSNPVIEKFKKQGGHSGGVIGDIGGGTGVPVSSSGGGRGGGASSTPSDPTGGTQIITDRSGTNSAIVQTTPSNVAAIEQARKAEQVKEEYQQRIQSTLAQTQPEAKVEFRDNVTTVTQGDTKTVYAEGGKYARVPVSATVRPEFIESPNVLLSNVEEKKAPQKIPESVLTSNVPVGEITAAKNKVPFITKLADYSTREKGSVAGILVGTGVNIFSWGKGRVEGFISFFNPKTYVNMYQAITHPIQTLESIGELGPSIYAHPEIGFEMVGQVQGYGQATKLTSKLAAKALLKPQAKQFIEVTAEESKVTPKEFKFLQKISEKPSADIKAALQEATGKTNTQETVVINLNKLNPKQIKTLSELQKTGKIESNFEIEIGKIEKPEVGFVYKTGKDFSTKAKSWNFMEKTKDTVQPIKETVAENKALSTMSKLKEVPKETAKVKFDIKPSSSVPIRDFKDYNLRMGGGFSSSPRGTTTLNEVMGTGSRYVLIEETEYIRELRPVQQLVFPSIEKINIARGIAMAGIAGRVAYSVSAGNIFSSPVVNNKIVPIYNIRQEIKTNLNNSSASVILQESKLKNNQNQILSSESSTKSESMTRQETSIAQRQELIQKSETMTKTKLDTLQELKSEQKMEMKMMKPFYFNMIRAATKKKKKLYKGQIRRKGKFFDIGTASDNPMEALAQTEQADRNTLAASGRVIDVESGESISPESFGGMLSPSFYRSRKEQNVFIQRKSTPEGGRLSTIGERREIQKEKRQHSIIESTGKSIAMRFNTKRKSIFG